MANSKKSICPECGSLVGLTPTGKVRKHHVESEVCDGVGEQVRNVRISVFCTVTGAKLTTSVEGVWYRPMGAYAVLRFHTVYGTSYPVRPAPTNGYVLGVAEHQVWRILSKVER